MTVLIDYTKGFFETTEGDTVGTVTGNATLDLSTGSVFSHTPTANTTFAFTNPAASGTSSSATLKLTGANVAVGYDLANASYDSVSFPSSGTLNLETNPYGITFKPDGTAFYYTGVSLDQILSYSLSTAWDLSTATYNNGANIGFNPRDIWFSDDGTKMFIVHTTGDAVKRYDLSTAWDVSTISLNSNTFHPTNTYLQPRGITLEQSGTKLFITDSGSLHAYNLSTAYDLSTASTDASATLVSFTVGSAPQFNSSGTKVWVIYNNQEVRQYSLSTGFDVSTLSYDNISFSLTSQDGTMPGMYFKPDGTKLYTIGLNNDKVYQYSTGSSALATITYPASVIWSGGTTPTAPANGETDVYTFYTDDGGTTYYGFVSGDALA